MEIAGRETDSVKELSDYPSRTLSTTWDLSFMQIEQQNVRAANLLRFLAYLDHQDRNSAPHRPAEKPGLAGFGRRPRPSAGLVGLCGAHLGQM
jgi:hypothetical protein